AEGETVDEALAAILSSAVLTTGADFAVARVLEHATRSLVARACAAGSPALATEVEGTRFPLDELAQEEHVALAELPAAVQRIADRSGATTVVQLPVRLGGRT